MLIYSIRHSLYQLLLSVVDSVEDSSVDSVDDSSVDVDDESSLDDEELDDESSLPVYRYTSAYFLPN